MTTLSQKYLKACEFDVSASSKSFFDCNKMLKVQIDDVWIMGGREESIRRYKLDLAVAELVAAMQMILDKGNLATLGKWDVTDEMKTIAYESLTKLEAAIKGIGA